MKNIILILLTILMTIQLTSAQDKRVHFAHGLGGDANSLGGLSEYLQSQCNDLETSNFTMNSTDGIDQYSSELVDAIMNEYNNTSGKDIAIGHSFGGVNLRNIDALNAESFGAYITIGSAHNGSLLATNFKNGNFKNWVDMLCKEVIEDPFDASYILNWVFSQFEGFKAFVSPLFCENLYQQILEGSSRFLGGEASIVDMQLNGPASQIPASSLPSVGIVCEVDSPVHWNLLNGVYGDNLPQKMAAREIQLRNMVKYLELSTITGIMQGFFFGPFTAIQIGNTTVQFQESYNQFRNIESGWNEMIGAGQGGYYVSNSTKTWTCDCWDIAEQKPVPCSGSPTEIIYDVEPDSNCTTNPDCWKDVVYNQFISNPAIGSDGLIPLDGQSCPGSIAEYYVGGVSHFEEPNDSGVWTQVKTTLDKEFSPDDAFHLENCF